MEKVLKCIAVIPLVYCTTVWGYNMDSSPRPQPRPFISLPYDDIEKIEKVVWAEARNEGVKGRDAIRSVILNRLASDRFGNDVNSVLTQEEFEPVQIHGSIDNIPITEDELYEGIAEFADLISLGDDITEGRTFFQNKKTTTARGTDFDGPDPLVIGKHTFTKGYEGQEPVTDTTFSHNVKITFPEEEDMTVQTFRRGGQPDEGGRKRRREFLRSIQGYSDRVESEKQDAIAQQDQSVEEIAKPVEQKRIEEAQGVSDKETRKPVSEAALKQTEEIISTPQELADRRRLQSDKLPAKADALPEADTKKPAKADSVAVASSKEGYQEIPDPISMNHGGIAMGLMTPDVITGIDPVSGNPIPLGSTASNVRDDIPAALSEGEYVAPADVVRWHGLKTYMEMQEEAKMGLMAMASMGQLKGIDYGFDAENTCSVCGGFDENCDSCMGVDEDYSKDSGTDDGDMGSNIETAQVTIVEEEYPMKGDSEGIKAYPTEVGQNFTVGDEQVLLVFKNSA